MYRFLASRGWLVRTLAGVALVLVFVRLGLWQLDRNDERSARNAVISRNEAVDPVPVDEVLATETELAADDEWRRIALSGQYDTGHEIVVQLRPLEGDAGVHVLTPLVTAEGTALLVDRGFVPTDGPATERPRIAPPPSGTVEVVARVRVSENARGTEGDPAQGSVRYVDVEEIGATLLYPVYGAWAELVSQAPEADEPLTALPPPEVDAGPHLSYAIQWFLFACVGVGGYVFLVRAEARGRRELAAGGDHSESPAASTDPAARS